MARVRPARKLPSARRKSYGELLSKLGLSHAELADLNLSYHRGELVKRSGEIRQLLIPNPDLLRVQRHLAHRVLSKSSIHPAVHGYVIGRSNLSHAAIHIRSEAVVRFDLRDFFGYIKPERAELYFSRVGWDRKARQALLKLCFTQGTLPQGAATSPALSNILNYRLDHRLAIVAQYLGARYTRYSDDLVFSWPIGTQTRVGGLMHSVNVVIRDEGYSLQRRKTSVATRATRQQVGGLVVNDNLNLPRPQRRLLRSMEHRRRTGQAITLSDQSFDGHMAYLAAVQSIGRDTDDG